MGGLFSGRYPRGSRPISKVVREFSLILDAPVLVKRQIIQGATRRVRDLESVCGGQFAHLIKGKIDVECESTLPLHQQTDVKHRLKDSGCDLRLHIGELTESSSGCFVDRQAGVLVFDRTHEP